MSSEHLNVRIVIENLEGGETYAQHFVMALPARQQRVVTRDLTDYTLRELADEMTRRLESLDDAINDDDGWSYDDED